MSLYTSLFSGVAGLRNHQTMLNVIGNNIANVNTIGFKSSRTTFAEMFSQTRLSAFRPAGENGGINPQQIGLGASVGSIDVSFSQGNLEASNSATDLGITGAGFFILQQNGQRFYSRVGNFAFDASGNMVLPGNGAILQGKLADSDGTIPANAQIQNLKLLLDKKAPAKETGVVKLAGNLDSRATAGTDVETTMQIYDSLGIQHTVTVTFTKTATANEWTWAATVPQSTPLDPMQITGGGSGTIRFNSDGSLASFDHGTASAMTVNPNNGANATQDIDLTPGTVGQFAGITQTGQASLISMRNQDGYTAGTLQNIAVDVNGEIQGKFSNGTIITLGQIILAEFNNPGGLTREADGLYSSSGNSGEPILLVAGENSTSTINGGVLEQSNVDLAEEFTRMIVAQRGYQSSARIITTTDEILQETVNLKR
ncbi:MAG: flagellar hook protein FlgE [Ignavibacteriae bacterium]|nr:flagellar hook protein FlgE [Ignavibacteriota bacterium]